MANEQATFYAKQIKKYRKQAHMTQEDVASKLNVAVSTISSWETGRTQVDIETFKQLAKLFDVNIHQLLGSNEDEVPKAETTRPLFSKTYWDIEYTFSKEMFILFLAAVLTTFIAPILQAPYQQTFIVLWFVYVCAVVLSVFKNHKSQTGIKYFHENETLYYQQSLNDKTKRLYKKQVLNLKWILLLSLNISLILPFGLTYTHIEDAVFQIIFVMVWLLSNAMFIYILIYDAKKTHTGEIIKHRILHTNLYLGRYKVLLTLYTAFFVFHYLALISQAINPYNSALEIFAYLIKSLTLITLYGLYELQKYYYAHYNIIVKPKKH